MHRNQPLAKEKPRLQACMLRGIAAFSAPMDAVKAFSVRAVAWLAASSWPTRVGVLLALLLAIAVLRELVHRRTYAHIRTWASLPLIGHVPYLLTAPWETFANLATQFGGMSMVYVWTKPLVIISDPEDVKRVLVSARSTYPKDDWSYEYFRDVLGHGLVTAEGEAWKSQRALLSPAFHFKALERLMAVFDAAAARFTNKIDAACASATPGPKLEASHAGLAVRAMGGSSGAEVELSSAFRQVTLEIISQVTLGLKPEDASVFPQLFEAVVDELNARVFEPWRAFSPLEITYRRRLNKLNSIVLNIIAQRRAQRAAVSGPSGAGAQASAAANAASADGDASGAEIVNGAGEGMSLSGKPIFANGCDILDMMLDSGLTLTDKQLSDEVKTQLMAGHETSSMMLTWSCYLLARHPEAMAKAVAEVDRVLGLKPGVTKTTVAGASVREEPHFDDYKALEYMGWVFKEAMRIYTPVPVLNRETAEEDTLGGVRVPAKTGVIISVWALHHAPKIWGKDVDEFRPERFSAEESRGRHTFAYMPFSVGSRNCIGQNLAISEAKVIMGYLLRNYTITLAPESETIHMDTKNLPLRPIERVLIRVTPRK